MKSVLVSHFEEIFDELSRNDSAVVYIPKFREFGIKVLNGPHGSAGNAFQEIFYCPFSGKKLPSSLRDRWFDEIEALGLSPDDTDVPLDYASEAWWVEKHL